MMTDRHAVRRLVSAASLVVLITVAGAATSHAAAGDQLRKEYRQTEEVAREMRTLAASVLKTVKQIDTDCRRADGRPNSAKVAEARRLLARAARLKEAYESAADQARRAVDALSGKLQAKGADSDARSELLPKVSALQADIDKYRGYVERFYGRAEGDFGAPPPPGTTVTSLAAGQKLALSGQATFGLGGGSYKRPNSTPVEKGSLADMSFGARATLAPMDNLNVTMNLQRRTQLERTKIALTDWSTSAVYNFGAAAVDGGLALQWYSNKNERLLSYHDFDKYLGFRYAGGKTKLNARLGHVGRSYSLVDVANYGTFSFITDASLPLGNGLVQPSLRFLSRSHEVKQLNHRELTPGVVFNFDNRMLAGASYQTISHPEFKNCPADSRRLKADLRMVRTEGARTVKWGPDVLLTSYPNNKQANFLEGRLVRESTSRGRKVGTARLVVTYRHVSDSMAFDFAQFEYRSNGQPIGSGMYRDLGVAAKAYVGWEKEIHPGPPADTVDVTIYSDPNTLDLSFGFGWVKAGSGWLRRLSFGPELDHRMVIDIKGEDRSYQKNLDKNLIFQNPGNSAGVGARLGLSGSTGTGTWRVTTRFAYKLRYNEDPRTHTTFFEIDGAASFRIAQIWLVDTYLRINSTRDPDKQGIDLDKFSVGATMTYLFDFGW